VDCTDPHEPVYYRPDAAAAYDAVLALRMATDPLTRLTGDERERALERLRTALAARQSEVGVWLHARAWIVTAQRLRPGRT
jgi:hypothetical protein